MDIENLIRFAKEVAPVFPIPGARKSPPIYGWQAWAARDEAKIRQHWNANPGDNAGAHAVGLLVLDIDVRHAKGGMEALRTLESEHGDLPETFTVRTPSGGEHRYFTLPEGVEINNNANKLLAGLDVRTRGGYVVAPGSRTPEGEYVIERDVPPAPAPQWLINLCAAPSKRDRNRNQAPVDWNQETAVQAALDFLKWHPVAVQGAGGDAHTYQTICTIRDLGVPKGRASEVLADWNSRCAPPWDPDGENSLETKIENAYEYGQNAPGSKSFEAVLAECKFQPIPGAMKTEPQVVTNEASNKLYTFPAADGLLSLNLRRRPVKRHYVIPNFLPAGITAILAGHGGSCKSLAALYLGVAVALGKPFFGCPRGTPGAVFIALGEEDADEAYRRMYGIVEQLQLTEDEIGYLGERTRLYPCLGKDVRLTGHKNGMLQSTKLGERIAAEMKAHAETCGLAPALIVLDHFMLFSGGEVNANEDAAAYARETAAMVAATGASVLTLAHSPKGDDGKKLDQHSVLGAVSTGNLGRLTLLIQRMTPMEAQKLGIAAETRWDYLNLWAGKANYTKTGQGFWLKSTPTEHDTVTLAPVELQPAADKPKAEEKAEKQTSAELLVAFLRAEEARGVRHTQATLEQARKRIGGLKRDDLRDTVKVMLDTKVLAEAASPKDKRKTHLVVLRDPPPFD